MGPPPWNQWMSLCRILLQESLQGRAAQSSVEQIIQGQISERTRDVVLRNEQPDHGYMEGEITGLKLVFQGADLQTKIPHKTHLSLTHYEADLMQFLSASESPPHRIQERHLSYCGPCEFSR